MNYPQMTVSDLRASLDSKECSVKDLVDSAKQVIKEKDDKVHAFIEVFDDLGDDINRAQSMIEDGSATFLTGIPVAIKDNICIEGREITAASRALKGFIAPDDADVIRALKEAGAICIGRTNMDEFGMGSSTEYSVYGPTYNPRDNSLSPGGSSGGSAAAVAMGAVPIALGSDTGGSVRQPASFCGVYGLKPTYGAISRQGLIALGSSIDCIGVFTRCVDDLTKALPILSKYKDGDSTSNVWEAKNTSSKKTIAVLKDVELDDDCKKAYEDAIEKISKEYTTIPVSLPIFEKASSIYYIIQPAEASSNLARYDGIRFGAKESGSNLWDTYLKTRSTGFGDEVQRRVITGTYVLSAGYADAYYRHAEGARIALTEELDEVFKKADVLLLPTSYGTPFKVGSKQDAMSMYREDTYTTQANLSGVPSLSVPVDKDLLFGVQIMAPHGREEDIYSYAKVVGV